MLNRIVQTHGLHDIRRAANGKVSIGKYTNIPAIQGRSIKEYGAWFLGPRAENQDILQTLITDALSHNATYRLGYQPGDPVVITDTVKNSPEFQASVANMKAQLAELLEYYGQFSTPFFSLRYQAHMLWDNTLPALAAYFATMLHNPNNVTIQASTSTTLLEIQVMTDLCMMIGWLGDGLVKPWAHITSGGSVANIEGTWAARENKYLPHAVRTALTNGKHPELTAAKNITVPVAGGSAITLINGSNWELFNICRNDSLALPQRIADMTGLDAYAVWRILVPYCPNALGLFALNNTLDGLGGPPVTLTPSTRHYSWPKSTATLGYGTDGEVRVVVDADGRMDMAALRTILTDCKDRQQPVLMVVAVFGSTEESAVDPIDEIVAMRAQFRKDYKMDFDIHVDAAWGGYQVSALRAEYEMDQAGGTVFIPDYPTLPVPAYTAKQLTHLRDADSATIDPHKSGYIQYPAGAILYANREVTNLITFTGAYIGPANQTSVGMFGLEGSRPGAAAGAVFFSHQCIRPDITGYGRITVQAWFNARMFYTQILCMNQVGDPFTPVPLSRLPAEKSGRTPEEIAAQKQYIRDNILNHSKAEIEANPTAMALYRETGPDQNIVDFGFIDTKRVAAGTWTVDAYNQLITDLYTAFSVGYDAEGQADDIHQYPFLVSTTTFLRADYGAAFMDTFAQRLGLPVGLDALNCLRSTVMTPYLSDEATADHYFPLIINALRGELLKLIG